MDVRGRERRKKLVRAYLGLFFETAFEKKKIKNSSLMFSRIKVYLRILNVFDIFFVFANVS